MKILNEGEVVNQTRGRSRIGLIPPWNINIWATIGILLMFLTVASMAHGAELVVTAVDRETRKGLPSAKVTLRYGNTTAAGDALTDKSGQARFQGLKPGGGYSAVVWFSGYRKEVIEVPVLDEKGENEIAVELSEYTGVSLIALLADPNRYDGKAVKVVGFLSVSSENDAIYLHKEDWKNNLASNAVWLDVLHFSAGDLTTLQGKYVLVEGDFNSKKRGHMGLFGGSIVNISRVVQWPQE